MLTTLFLGSTITIYRMMNASIYSTKLDTDSLELTLGNGKARG